MSPEQKERVRESWQGLLPRSQAAAEMFYQRLFIIDSSIRPLFEGVDMADQGRKLMMAIGTLVQSLEMPAELNRILDAMGRRHAHYGVVESHYESFGAALLWTLEQVLDETWTDETRDAWTAGYGVMARAMRQGARGV